MSSVEWEDINTAAPVAWTEPMAPATPDWENLEAEVQSWSSMTTPEQTWKLVLGLYGWFFGWFDIPWFGIDIWEKLITIHDTTWILI